MSDPNRSDNWRLEESGETAGRWKLEEAEQNRISQWTLQDDPAYDPAYEEAEWQPVEYAREPYQQESRSGWVLPALVGLALIAVVAYGVWIGMTQLDPSRIGTFLNPLSTTPEPTTEVAAIAPAEEATATLESAPVEEAPSAPTVAPTATPPPPTPTTPPTPALVEERYVTVTAQYGINARREPSADAEILRVIEQGEEFLVLDEQPEWLQVLSAAGQPAWISSDPQWVEQRTEQLTLEEANQARAELGVDLLPGGTATVGDSGPSEVTVAPTAAPVEETAGITGSAPITGGLSPIRDDAAVDAPDTAGAPIAGTVNITGGLNARGQPDLNGELIALLENGTQLSLTGRTADSGWLRSSLENGTPVWVAAQYVAVDGDVANLPVVDETGVEAPTLTITATTAPAVEEPTAGEADTAEEAPAETTAGGATASVNSLLGAAIRNAPEPSADAVDNAVFENVLTVTGRSIDNEWLQVDLGSDQRGWVLASAVDLSVPIETLPVVTP